MSHNHVSDLTVLTRGRGGRAQDQVTRVPAPPFHWKTRILLPAAILVMAAALVAYAARDALLPSRSVRVVAALVKASDDVASKGTVVAQAPGWVEADPFPTAVSALTDGVVQEMLVLEGEFVEAGQIVATLVDDDLRIALDRAEAMHAERQAAMQAERANLEEAQRNWDHPIELTRRLKTRRAQLEQKHAELVRWPYELAVDQAQAVYLKAEYDRISELRQRGQAAEIELIRAEQEYEAQQARVEFTRKREAILKAEILALEAEVAAADEDLQLRIVDTRALAESKAAVRLAEAAVATAAATRADAALQFERTKVRAPASGTVMTRLVEPGSKLVLRMDNPYSAQVVRLYDPKRLQVRVDVPLVDAAKVGVGQPAEIIVDVLPDRVYRGEVSRVVHEADVQKNTLQVKVAIEEPTAELMPEMLARARFLSMGDAGDESDTSTSTQTILVPRSSTMAREGRSFVWIADQIGKVAILQPVTLGRRSIDDWVEVSSGVRPGDRVIIEPPADLADGERIHWVEE